MRYMKGCEGLSGCHSSVVRAEVSGWCPVTISIFSALIIIRIWCLFTHCLKDITLLREMHNSPCLPLLVPLPHLHFYFSFTVYILLIYMYCDVHSAQNCTFLTLTCPIAMVIAAADVNPLMTGRGMKSIKNPAII